jgi:hypothetical protein
MELSTGNAARRDPLVREQLKKAQQARLVVKEKVAKGKIEASQYSELYEKQPDQVARRAVAEVEARARREARESRNADAIAAAKGSADVFEKAAGAKK